MGSQAGVESEVDLHGLAYPLLGFWLDIDAGGEAQNERFRRFVNAEAFGVATGRELRLGQRLGMIVLDNRGQTYRISNVENVGFAMPHWLRILMWVTRDTDSIQHYVHHKFVAYPSISFKEAKARVGASIERNKDDWIDDEAMAGEAGEPVKLEDVIAGAVAAVHKAQTVQDLFERLDEAWRY